MIHLCFYLTGKFQNRMYQRSRCVPLVQKSYRFSK